MKLNITDTRKYIEIQDWLAEKNNIEGKECTIERETEKAMLINVAGVEHWIPKSQASIEDVKEVPFSEF